MATNFDDFDGNPFFKSLQTVFKVKFDEAQKRQWVICVPQTISIKSMKITGQFVDSHILKPSPYFKSHFVTTDKNNNRTLQIDGNVIRILSGNSASFENGEVKILAEELSYNHDYLPFKLYLIDHPLNSANYRKGTKADINLLSQYSMGTKPVITLQQCKHFLQSVPSHSEVLENLDKAIFRFNKNYMVLPNYLHDASNKLKDIITWATESFLELNPFQADEEKQLSKILQHAIENYVLVHVNNKVFSVIREKYSEEDKLLCKRIQELYHLGLTADQLGVREEFCYPTTGAVVELASLNGKASPAEKLNCLQATLELIPDDIYNSYKENDNNIPFKKVESIPSLTSDDLIPLLVTVIIQARIQNLESNLFYIQNFSFNSSNRDKHCFSLVTFQAAKEFIISHDFRRLKPSSKKIRKEISLEELMSVTALFEKNTKLNLDDHVGKLNDIPLSPVDKHLHRVTKMIEDSTREEDVSKELYSDSLFQSSCTFKSVFTPKKDNISLNSKSEELGEFLFNLQENNCLGVTYGRQS